MSSKVPLFLKAFISSSMVKW